MSKQNPQPRQYAPDEVNEHGEYIKIGGSPVPGLNLHHILREHTDVIYRIAWSPGGRYLASASKDCTIRIWEGQICITTLKENNNAFLCLAWSASGLWLASGSDDNIVRIWNTQTWKLHKKLRGHTDKIWDLAWSPDDKRIVSSSQFDVVKIWESETGNLLQSLSAETKKSLCIAWSPDGQNVVTTSNNTIKFWNPNTGKLYKKLDGHKEDVFSLIWTQDRNFLLSGSRDKTIILWNLVSGEAKELLEGHTGDITSLSISADGKLLASQGFTEQIHLWKCETWELLSSFGKHNVFWTNASFHPNILRLAATDANSLNIYIWDLNIDVLDKSTPSIQSRYTTAKLVIVGDSGVGKTGLGWRLAHGEFKEHASTHGQQFWSIPQLGLKRKDGTDCEAVLWDLAGQHVYRQVHSIFLDNVSAALVLFDPSNRQEPLKGAQFWLEQLKGKGKLPPTILVGARVDRGAPALSQADLDQFCQRYGITGGYISTSALKGDGLAELLERLKAQIPWDEMTATVTTVTFKRIKDYVLSLKEKTDRKGVLVSPAELRRLLETTSEVSQDALEQSQAVQTSEVWTFTDPEMMTAVGHLETNGIVTILKSSSGESHILLTPELLVNVAASIMLLADKNARELGAVSETELLGGKVPFDELKGLDKSEQQILTDAAIRRFLEHNICFRETFNDDTLLVFPSLIKQKRPLQDDLPATDDVSYVVRGRVENLYASLVVLLGYTPSFTRINQWQNQAQYEMREGEICGFRLIEEREGEIELVLYYADSMPQTGRDKFQELFEQFLYQREVDVTRFPPVVCKNGHMQKRVTVVERVREKKPFMFCDECGDKVSLPDFEAPQTIGFGASPWLQREEALARLRSAYEKHLTNIKSYRRSWAVPRAYLSHLPEQRQLAKDLTTDLRDAGVYVAEKVGDVQPEDFFIILDTSAYQRAYQTSAPALAADCQLLRTRMSAPRPNILSLVCEGTPTEHDLPACKLGSFCDETHYPVSLFDLILKVYAIPPTHKGFEPLRLLLHQQWENTLARLIQADLPPVKPTDSTPEPEVETEKYLDFDLHIAPNGYAVASSDEGQATAEIPVQLPQDLQLALQLIQNNATNADLLKQFGTSLYHWLFPTPIHTHLHQTEARARVENAKIRLRLRVEPASIASLPLELLYRENGGYYLALNPATVLSRYLNLTLPPGRVRRRDGALHMLVILSEPSDQGKFQPETWDAMFREALSRQIQSGELTIDVVTKATRAEISAALKRQKPDIVQYVGHGQYKDGKGHILLVNEETGKSWPVTDEIFANLFMGYDDHLGLVSLTACESAESSAPQAFVGVAPKLVERGTPAVIAMQYAVKIASAKLFFEEFYASLAAHKPVDWAVQSARNAVSQQYGLGNREFATPVLYMRAKDGAIMSEL